VPFGEQRVLGERRDRRLQNRRLKVMPAPLGADGNQAARLQVQPDPVERHRVNERATIHFVSGVESSRRSMRRIGWEA
jgi:hypothetical protein